jgi:hypothetical protein
MPNQHAQLRPQSPCPSSPWRMWTMRLPVHTHSTLLWQNHSPTPYRRWPSPCLPRPNAWATTNHGQPTMLCLLQWPHRPWSRHPPHLTCESNAQTSIFARQIVFDLWLPCAVWAPSLNSPFVTRPPSTIPTNSSPHDFPSNAWLDMQPNITTTTAPCALPTCPSNATLVPRAPPCPALVPKLGAEALGKMTWLYYNIGKPGGGPHSARVVVGTAVMRNHRKTGVYNVQQTRL